MPVEVFTEEWSRACCERLNAREAYRQVAGDWKDPVVLVLSADVVHGFPEERAVYLDLSHGRCRGARVATPADFDTAPIVLRADAVVWRRMLEGGLDPATAVVQGLLRLERGSLLILARYAAAAREMVAAAADAGGVFPPLPA